jgi:hypothetical protein
MKLWPEKKSDEDYIESIRQLISRGNQVCIHYAIIAVLCLLLFVVYWLLLRWFASSQSQFTGGLRLGFGFGILLGGVAGIFLFSAMYYGMLAIRGVDGYRAERLMIRFHDELKGKTGDSRQSRE